MHVRPAGIDADFAQYRDRGVTHDLVFFVGEGQRRCHGHAIAGMDTHRIDILDRADDDAIVRLVADHFHLELFPAQYRFLDQHLAHGRGLEAAFDDADEFFLRPRNAAAGAAQGEARTDDGGEPHIFKGFHRFFHGLDLAALRAFQADPVHRFTEQEAVFGHVDRMRIGANKLNAELGELAGFVKRHRSVERRLPTHGGKHRVGTFLLDDLRHNFRRDRLDVSCVGQIRIGHDGGRVRVHQDDPIPLCPQRLARLCPGIIELASLPDDDGAGADDEDRFDVSAFGHNSSQVMALER